MTSPLTVYLPSLGQDVAVLAKVCTDPDCDATDVHVTAVRLEDQDNPDAPALLHANVDLQSRALLTDPAGDPRAAAELLAALPDDWWTKCQRDQVAARSEERSLRSARIPRSNIERGVITFYSDVASPYGSLLNGGRAHPVAFTVNGRTYFVEDGYCPNPTCDCRAVHLFVTRLDEVAEDELEAQTVLVVRRRFAGGEDEFTEDSAEGRAVLAVWDAEHALPLSTYEDHYQQLRAVAARSLEARSFRTRAKIARNGPCPCGSGRRYKACCGR